LLAYITYFIVTVIIRFVQPDTNLAAAGCRQTTRRTVLESVRRTEANESKNYYVQFAELQKCWEITNVSSPNWWQICNTRLSSPLPSFWQETRLETRLVRKIIIWNQM